MGMTIEDIIHGLKETYMICCSVYAYDRKKYIDGAIDRLHKYQMIQTDYENRLKADMVAMLDELDLELYEKYDDTDLLKVKYVRQAIRQKINALKENK